MIIEVYFYIKINIFLEIGIAMILIGISSFILGAFLLFDRALLLIGNVNNIFNNHSYVL